MTSRPIRVWIVDDDQTVRWVLEKACKQAGMETRVFERAEHLLDAISDTTPDVLITDVRMPGIGGLAATRKIVSFDPDIKVIALTAYTDDPFPAKLIQAGAKGFITKGANPEQMLDAIRKVNSGQRYISPEVAQDMALRPYAQDTKESPFTQLSERELQIALMISSCDKVRDIATKLSISTKTVNSYRYRLFEKLGMHPV